MPGWEPTGGVLAPPGPVAGWPWPGCGSAEVQCFVDCLTPQNCPSGDVEGSLWVPGCGEQRGLSEMKRRG